MAVIDLFNVRSIVIGLWLGLLSVILWRRCCLSARDVPGPFLASMTRLWHTYHYIVGDHHWRLIELHDRYGNVSKISCSSLSNLIMEGTSFDWPIMKSPSATQRLSKSYSDITW